MIPKGKSDMFFFGKRVGPPQRCPKCSRPEKGLPPFWKRRFSWQQVPKVRVSGHGSWKFDINPVEAVKYVLKQLHPNMFIQTLLVRIWNFNRHKPNNAQSFHWQVTQNDLRKHLLAAQTPVSTCENSLTEEWWKIICSAVLIWFLWTCHDKFVPKTEAAPKTGVVSITWSTPETSQGTYFQKRQDISEKTKTIHWKCSICSCRDATISIGHASWNGMFFIAMSVFNPKWVDRTQRCPK